MSDVGRVASYYKDGQPIRPLVPYKETVVRVAGHLVLVLEFSFKRQRELAGTLEARAGQTILPNEEEYQHGLRPVIYLDADSHPYQREWTLLHERHHVERWYREAMRSEELWDEFEVELLTARDFPSKKVTTQWTDHLLMVRALKAYMRSGPAKVRAAALTQLMKEAVDEYNAQRPKRKRATRVPKDPVQGGEPTGTTGELLPVREEGPSLPERGD